MIIVISTKKWFFIFIADNYFDTNSLDNIECKQSHARKSEPCDITVHAGCTLQRAPFTLTFFHQVGQLHLLPPDQDPDLVQLFVVHLGGHQLNPRLTYLEGGQLGPDVTNHLVQIRSTFGTFLRSFCALSWLLSSWLVAIYVLNAFRREILIETLMWSKKRSSCKGRDIL